VPIFDDLHNTWNFELLSAALLRFHALDDFQSSVELQAALSVGARRGNGALRARVVAIEALRERNRSS
jgi:hypothetical protein